MTQEMTQKISFFENLKHLVAFLGLFAALCYLLGRWQIETYYDYLTISPNMMSFSIYDYMFSSLNMVALCLVISICVYISWRLIRPDQVWDLKNISHLHILTISLVVLGLIYNILLIFIQSIYIPVLSGGIFGLTVGCLFIFAVLPLEPKRKQNKGNKGLNLDKMQIFLSIMTATLIVVSLPFFNIIFARIQANIDKAQFYPVSVVLQNLSTDKEINSSEYSCESIVGNLVIVNNEMVFLISSDNSSSYHQIHAIPISNIKEITYFLVPTE